MASMLISSHAEQKQLRQKNTTHELFGRGLAQKKEGMPWCVVYMDVARREYKNVKMRGHKDINGKDGKMTCGLREGRGAQDELTCSMAYFIFVLSVFFMGTTDKKQQEYIEGEKTGKQPDRPLAT
eukprot:scaffold18961_cov23-Tisochrysis_lutea.AAC.2